jgi:L-lactate dehydrogenase complex protein LldG
MELDALIEKFTAVATGYTATVSCIPKSPETLFEELRKVTEGSDSILLAEPDDLAAELFIPFRSTHGVFRFPDEATLVSAEYGVSDAFAGVACTGSVCVSISTGLGGTVSLFPRKHIAVVDANTIVARPRDLLVHDSLRQKILSRNFVFISGPSATADMGPLVRGVHGPGNVHVIILV